MILAHNHLSGDWKSGEADIALTRKLLQEDKLLAIFVIDHLIVRPPNYCSFADDGFMTG